jgi:hypothetical protein
MAKLPAPDRGAADLRPTRDLEHRQALGREQDDPGPPHVLERAVAVSDDSGKVRAVLGADDDPDLLGHAPKSACREAVVNPLRLLPGFGVVA